MSLGVRVAMFAASVAVIAIAAPAHAQQREFNIPSGSLQSALEAFGLQTSQPIIYRIDDVRNVRSPGYRGFSSPPTALTAILAGTGFSFTTADSGALAIVKNAPARTSEAAPPPSDSSSDSGETEAIVVTAQKRSENIQKVPLAISAVSSAKLESMGVTSSLDLKLAVPSLDAPITNGYLTPYIRGIGSKANGPATENPVSTYIDGVYIGSAASALLSFNNIERVEVLKGPQGTLFGRNATGGLISVVTRDPSYTLSGQVSASYGNYDTARGDVYISGPISDGVRADIAAYGQRQGRGYGKILSTGAEVGRVYGDYAIRSKWLFDLTDSLSFRLIGDYSYLKTSTNAQRLAIGATPSVPFGPAYGGSPWDTDVSVEPLLTNKAGGVSGRFDLDIADFATFSSITAYRRNYYKNRFDIDLTATEGRSISYTQDDNQFSQELQLVSNSPGPLQWVGGLFYWRARGEYQNFRIILNGPARPGATQTTLIFGRQDVESVAPFAQLTYAVAPSTKVTLGVRYTYEARDQHSEQRQLLPSGVQQGATAILNQGINASRLTWRMAVDHQFSDDVLGYLSYNRGFKSGGANASSVTAPVYRPETLDAYEVGLKTQLFDRRVRVNGAAFYYDYADLQVLRILDGAPAIYNGAKARIYGAEVEAEARIGPNLTLTGGYTYLDAKFTEFNGSAIVLPDPNGGLRQTFGSVTGNRLPTSPKSVFSASATYAIPVDDNELRLNANYYYNSGYFGEADNYRRQKAYNLINANIEYLFGDKQYSVSVWGKNLTNTAVDIYPSTITTGGVSPLGGNRAIARSNYAPPRTYGVTVGAKF